MEDCKDNMKPPNSSSAKCLICYTKIEKTDEPAPTAFQKNVMGDGSLPSASLLLRQLRTIFILKHLFNHPSQKLVDFLKIKGNPADWFEICHVCNEKVNRAKVIFDELQILKLKILKAKSKFTNTKFNFREKVKATSSVHDGEDDPAFQFVLECRKFICQGKAKEPPPSLAQMNRESSGLDANKNIEAENGTRKATAILKKALSVPSSSALSHVVNTNLTSDIEPVNEPAIREKDEVPFSPFSHVDDFDEASEMEVNNDLPLSIERNEEFMIVEPYQKEVGGVVSLSTLDQRTPYVSNVSPAIESKSVGCKGETGSGIGPPQAPSPYESSFDEPSPMEVEPDLSPPSSQNINEATQHPKPTSQKKRHSLYNVSSKVQGKGLYSCSLCNDGVTHKAIAFFEHILTHHLISYKCKMCTHGFPSLKYMSIRPHWDKKHADIKEDFPVWELRVEKVTPSLPKIVWWCPDFECPENFEQETERDAHIEECHPTNWRIKPRRQFECGFCSKVYFGKAEVKLHELIDHQEKYIELDGANPQVREVYQETSDGKRVAAHFFTFESPIYPSVVKVANPADVREPPPPEAGAEEGKPRQPPLAGFLCSKCPDKIFKTRREHQRHEHKVHELSDRKFSCDLCGIKRSSNQMLEFHKAKVHGINVDNVYCSKCDRWFRYKGKRLAHTCGEHLNRKKVKCSKCGKDYASKYKLQYHMAIVHERKYRQVCDICGIQVGLASYAYHKASAHNIGDYKCPEESCTKVFSRQRNLDEHVKFDHKGESDYICEICGKGYKSQDFLRQHKKVMHETDKSLEQFKCNLCDKRFANKIYLKYHINGVHEKKLNRRRK